MNTKFVALTAIIISVMLMQGSMMAFAADTLTPVDFQETSWSKTIDFFDYVRAYAAAYGFNTSGLADVNAFTQLTYINVGALQVLSWGLANITANDTVLTIPTQTTLMHFRTQNETRHAITISSFVMLMAFNDSAGSLYPDSPDVGDTLYASFTLGYNLSSAFPEGVFPPLDCVSQYIPLTHPDLLHWHWGMKYTNLTAFWWRVFINPLLPHFDLFPVAMTVYDELTFTCDLTIDPLTHTATLTENHVIGRMRDLWLFNWLLPALSPHLNSTGTYLLNGNLAENETIYQFLDEQAIKMSIIDFQTTFLLDAEVHSEASTGTNVTDTEVDVSNSSIGTFSQTGEAVVNATFGTKQDYNLFNYTADQTETLNQTYPAVTRTVKIAGFANNPALAQHLFLMRFYPLFVAHLYAPMYNRAVTYFSKCRGQTSSTLYRIQRTAVTELSTIRQL